MDENVLGNVVGSLIDRNNDNMWGGGNGIWVILLIIMFMSGGCGWGNRCNANTATTQDVAASSMFNQIDNGIRFIERGQADTNMLVQGTGANLAQAIAESAYATKNCCCETNSRIDNAKYELSKSIDANRYELTKDVDALRYQMAEDTCKITTNDTANTQKILDKLCSMETNALKNENEKLRFDLQAAQLTLANAAQTQNIVGAIKPTPVPAYVVANPYCQCGTGYGYGTAVV